MRESLYASGPWAVLTIASALVLAAAIAGVWLLSTDRGDARGTSWDGYRADVETLVIYKVVRRCDELVGADVEGLRSTSR